MIYKLIKIFFITFALLNVNTVIAETELNGYLSTQFGMSANEVRTVIEEDGIVFSSSETTDGDHLIFAQRKQSWITSDLLYVFPANSDRLALIIEIFPGLFDTTPIQKKLAKQLGNPSSDNYPESVLKKMQESNLIPTGVNQLSVWNITANGNDREARLMGLEKYVRVEYIDNDLMAGK
ncbi:MAG: hypothetical protein HND53_13685 [Proteobacteria bacterium]|nr:hypothetical protein [Pseudomonadota bacterium]NOG61549.1 hypothetical protein [Pseudomonadota bacterium]